MAVIVPAILPQSFEELRTKAESVAHAVSLVQIDVCDGKFVPSRTWPYTTPGDENFLKLMEEMEGLPSWESLDYEVDLMVADPLKDAEIWIRAGVLRVIVHAESTNDLSEVVFQILERFAMSGSVVVGVAIENRTPISVLEPVIDRIGMVQVMGIEKIGFQGQPFDMRTPDRVRELKERYPELILSVDGGVNNETAPLLIAAGADRLAIGSAIFDSVNPLSAIEHFESI